VEGVVVEPTAEFAQLQLGFVDQTQWRYEVIRPLVLFADRAAAQRAQETDTHPDTVRTLRRRFRQQCMSGLLPADVGVVHRRRASPVPEHSLVNASAPADSKLNEAASNATHW
jgi:hypothetical protein